MKNWIKKGRFTLLFLLVCIVVSTGTPAAMAYEHPGGIWAYLKQWDSAWANGDYDTIIRLADPMMALYNGESSNKDNCNIRRSICEKAARACEVKGNLEKAVEWYNREQEYNNWLNSNGTNYAGRIMLVKTMIRKLNVSVELYVETSDPTNVPYYGVLGVPEAGILQGSNVDGSISGSGSESAELIYVEFDPDSNYDMGHWTGKFACDSNLTAKDILENGGVIEVAWNFPKEGNQLDDIISGKNDTYIRESMEYLASSKATFLLRIGAEMNCWTTMPDASKFKAAFIRIADIAYSTGANIATVFSPNDVSYWGKTYTDYYPGDSYVDWIGVSTYYHASPATSSYTLDAYYNRGAYSNDPLTAISELVEIFPNKPMVISECGFSFNNGTDTTNLAVDRLTKFYTYLPMVYPQVKAVFYFDQNSDSYHYKFADNATVANRYKSIVANNPYLSLPRDTAAIGYTRLSTICEKTDKLNIYTYAIFPNGETTSCVYRLDGNTVKTTSESVLSLSLPVSDLSVGWHTLTANVTSGNISRVVARKFYVNEDGVVQGSNDSGTGRYSDVPVSEWYYGCVQYVTDYGLFDGTSPTSFEPSAKMTRAMFVKVLGSMAKLMGEDVSGYTSNFKDVESGTWYTEYVGWAAAKGIITGYDSNTFGTNDSVTREQMMALLVRFADYKGLALGTGVGYSFKDAASISGWARDDMNRAAAAGIIAGYEDGTLRPQGTASRAEVAAVFQRFSSAYGV